MELMKIPKQIILGESYRRPSFLVFSMRLVVYSVLAVSTVEYYHATFGLAAALAYRAHDKITRAADAMADEPRPAPTEQVEPLVPVEPENGTPEPRDYSFEQLREIVDAEARAQNVPTILAEAVVMHESGWQVDATKFEVNYLNHRTCAGISHPDRKRLCASSHGLFQVMFSIHKANCDLSTFSQLYDPKINARCGVKILRQCADRWQTAPRWQRVSKTLECFNGSPEYPPRVLAALGAIVAEDLT